MTDEVSRMSKKELEREVRRLRELLNQSHISQDDLEILQILQDGQNATQSAALAKAIEQRDRYKTEVEKLKVKLTKYEDWIPHEVVRTPKRPPHIPPHVWKDLKMTNTVVSLSLAWRDDTKPEFRSFRGLAEFSGSADEFETEAIPQITLIAFRGVLPEDIGNQTVEGLTKEDLAGIARRLDDERNIYGHDSYLELRAKIFDDVWPLIEASGMYNYKDGRRDAKSKFNKFCDNTLKYAQARRKKFRLPAPKDGRINLRKIFSSTDSE